MSSELASMKRIGILGGSSDQATADYYRQLNAAVKTRLGGWNTAELVLTSMNFAFSEECVRNERWEEMGEYLAGRARALEGAGADFYLCVSNTLHRVAPVFQTAVTIPFLHIAVPTAAAINAAGLKTVALLGTKAVMAADFQRRRYEELGISIIVPSVTDMNIIDRIIFEELCVGIFSQKAREDYLKIIDKLSVEGAEGVILGCTEIPLLIKQLDRPHIPMFDTMALHVSAAVEQALSK